MTEMNHQRIIAIAANFTADPIQESLEFWLRTICFDYKIQFAPYDQIFQQLLDPQSLLSQNNQGMNIILIGLEDWVQKYSDINNSLDKIKPLSLALKSARDRHPTPYLISLTPGSPEFMADVERSSLFQKIQDFLWKELKEFPGIDLISYSELVEKYPVKNYYNPYGKHIGEITYTDVFFTALGTMLARKIHAINHPGYKVIVLDCDGTLWNGVVSEEGALGIEIDSERIALQQFTIEQYEAGILLCLCSKNNEQDVLDVFARRPEMPLKQNYLVSWRINWLPKSENIKSLATELNLGLNSFIFIDDNPVECAEVKANCPEVLTLQVPEESDTIPRFLNHVWAFDRINVTQEDRHRTQLYRQNIQREKFKQTFLDLETFIAGLNLKVNISELIGEHIPRVSQLTQRTNQFNFTTIRRSQSEVQNLWNSQAWECLTVSVSDRFGDYGLVGTIVFQQKQQVLEVDTFLLSCRVLGRGVEHQMLAHLGAIAQARGLKSVNVLYLPTQKNQPALNFLDNCGVQFKRSHENGWIYQFPVEQVAKLTYSTKQSSFTTAKKQPISTKHTSQDPQYSLNHQYYLKIAEELYDPETILQLIQSQKPKQQRPNLSTEYVPASTALQTLLVSLFQEILAIEPIGIYDNFFDLGGDSLKAALFLNKLGDRLGTIIYAVALLNDSTIDKISEYLTQHYPTAIAKLLGNTPIDTSLSESVEKINLTRVNQLRQSIKPLSETPKNRPAIFILSPPRSGSTLLRVMLAGHPQLFAPPELHLMSFNHLGDRKERLEKFWSQGIIQAIKELKNISTEAAKDYLNTLETLKLPTNHLYKLLQDWAGDRLLVDKTPLYALDVATLERIETYFENPLYIHLIRHPYGMIHSFEEVKLDLILTQFSHPNFNRRELAELFWLICHDNIFKFFGSVPKARWCQVKYEDLVHEPENTLNILCDFLGVKFSNKMLNIYERKHGKMLQDIYGGSRILGDPKFNHYRQIESDNAEKWQKSYTDDFLGKITWEMAARLGYDRSIANLESNSKTYKHSCLVNIRASGDRRPIFCVHPIGGGVFCYNELAHNLGSDRPIYALQAPGFNGEQEPLTTIEAMAKYYIDAIGKVQPKGPYLIGGWSLGGTIAFEMAHQLKQKQQDVGLLFLIDSFSPEFYQIVTDETTLLVRFADNFGQQVGKEIQISYQYLEPFEIDEQLYIVWQQAKNIGAIDPDMELRQMRSMWKVYRANLQALQQYQPNVYADQIVFFQASEHIREDDYTSGGWDRLSSANLQVHKMPGNHYTIMRSPYVQLLANRIGEYLKCSH